MATDSLIAVNQQILKIIDGMIKSLKHIEESEIDAVKVEIRESDELEAFATRHLEFLSKHPQYKRLVELTAAAGKTEKDRRLIAAKLIRQEYGPLLELRKQVEDELEERDDAVKGEKAELEKDFEFTIKDHKGPDSAPIQLELTVNSTNTKYYFAEFRNANDRANFEATLIAECKNTLKLERFIVANFKERNYKQTISGIPTPYYYWAAKENIVEIYGDLLYYQDKDGSVRPDFTKWNNKLKLEQFAINHLNKLLPKQQETLEAINAQAIQLAEQRVAEQLEQEKSLKEIVEKKIKVEAKEFDEIHAGKIPEKYKNLVKELSSPKYLHNVIERARNSTDDKFKDKPVEVLKQDIDQKIPQDEIGVKLKGLLLTELVPKLEKELNVLATRKPKSLIVITLKEALDEFKKLTATVTSLAAYNDNKDAKALKQKIDYVRNLIVSSPLTRQERVKAVRFFNVVIVKAMIKFYTSKALGFTVDQVTRQIPALREVTTEELSRYK